MCLSAHGPAVGGIPSNLDLSLLLREHLRIEVRELCKLCLELKQEGTQQQQQPHPGGGMRSRGKGGDDGS